MYERAVYERVDERRKLLREFRDENPLFIIPASPGWTVLVPDWSYFDRAGNPLPDSLDWGNKDASKSRIVGFFPEPVIAWMIHPIASIEEVSEQNEEFVLGEYTTPYCRPVCINPIANFLEDNIPLKRPDGMIVFVEDREFENEEEALEYANKLYQEGIERKKRFREAKLAKEKEQGKEEH